MPKLEIGGTELQVIEFIRRIRSEHWEPTLFLMRWSDFQVEELLEEGIMVDMPRRSSASRLAVAISSVWRYWAAQRARRSHIVHFFLPETYILLGLASLLFGPNVRVMSRRSLNQYQKKYVFSRRIERFLHRRVDVLTGNSEIVCRELRNECPAASVSKVSLIYNGVAPPAARRDDGPANRDGEGNDAAFTFGIVGNLYPYKGHLDLIEAFGLVRDRLPPDWTLACAGRDRKNMLAACQVRAAALKIDHHIQWLGLVPRDEVLDLIGSFDVLILASHEEGLPNVLLEAMIREVPVIGTRVGGAAEVIDDRKTGLLVPARDPRSMSEAIIELAGDEGLRAALGKAAAADVRRRFSFDRVVEEHRRVYERAMKHKAGPGA